MKQVWIINHYAQEPDGAGGTRHFHLAKYLEACGWQATVIAASVELNSGRQRLDTDEAHRLERVGGVPFLWVRTPTYRGNGGGRMRNMLAFMRRVMLARPWPSFSSDVSKPVPLSLTDSTSRAPCTRRSMSTCEHFE